MGHKALPSNHMYPAKHPLGRIPLCARNHPSELLDLPHQMLLIRNVIQFKPVSEIGERGTNLNHTQGFLLLILYLRLPADLLTRYTKTFHFLLRIQEASIEISWSAHYWSLRI